MACFFQFVTKIESATLLEIQVWQIFPLAEHICFAGKPKDNKQTNQTRLIYFAVHILSSAYFTDVIFKDIQAVLLLLSGLLD